jgi:Tfp pilus assembly protein PilF
LYSALGYSFEVLGEYQSAITAYQKGLDIDGASVEMLLKIGDIYEIAAKPSLAHEYYDNAEKKLSPQTDASIKASLFIRQGRRYVSGENNRKKGEDYFSQAAKIAPSIRLKSEANARLSMIFFLDDDNLKALHFAQVAITTDKTNALGYAAIMQVMMKDRDVFHQNRVALDEYGVTMQALQSHQSWVHFLLGRYYFFSGDIDKSITETQTALAFINQDFFVGISERNPLRCQILLTQTLAYLSKQDTESATTSLRLAFQSDPQKAKKAVQANNTFNSIADALPNH